jgi:ppGpp synthetase/RelA/SpoT-type nucleotidyltranferase
MSSQVNDADELSKTWTENPSVLRSFIEIRPQYEQLCDEIEDILTKLMSDSGIEFSTITTRAKSLRSFAEKLFRKPYPDPLNDITDLAGVRLVYLYKSDRSRIEQLIESEFDVLEKADKIEE